MTTGSTQGRASGKTRQPFIFHGKAGEYFGIWIVNVLLTIVTLGIYSAWAKVRRNRYFYGNTELGGSRFEYLASPMQILIGRIIVVVALVVINLLTTFLPLVGIIVLIALFFAFPELVRRGLRFAARTTAYRNVRFDFSGTYGGAFLAIFAGPLLAMLTFGLAAPVASRWTQRFILGNLTYGGRPFANTATNGAYYRVFWLPFLLFVGAVVISGLAAAAMLPALAGLESMSEAEQIVAMLPFVPAYFIVLALFGSISMIYAAGVRNVAFNHTAIDGRHDLVSNVGRWSYVWLMISNFIVTALTFGLMRPWAAVRHARFLAAATNLDVQGDLAGYANTVRESRSAVGAEYMDIEGVEIGL